MNGNSYQNNPTKMFQDWIQRSGEAQAEFVKNFGALMTSAGSRSGTFNPLETLQEISKSAQNVQSQMIEDVSSMQARGLDAMLGMGQNLIPSMASWGTYKTAVSSNGRISIPEAERNALDIEEGDLVQVIILPIPNRRKKREVNKQA